MASSRPTLGTALRLPVVCVVDHTPAWSILRVVPVHVLCLPRCPHTCTRWAHCAPACVACVLPCPCIHFCADRPPRAFSPQRVLLCGRPGVCCCSQDPLLTHLLWNGRPACYHRVACLPASVQLWHQHSFRRTLLAAFDNKSNGGQAAVPAVARGIAWFP